MKQQGVRLTVLLWGMLCTTSVFAQREDLNCVWPAQWIASEGPAKEYSVHHFRKIFSLEEVPDSLVIHTSGDNRYQLFVNGQLATWGPLRGDLRHWYYESTDIAPWLQKGKNVLAVVVLNYGSHPPDAQLSVQTGFLLAADRREHRFLNTPTGWQAKHNPAYSPNVVGSTQVQGYYGGGSKEIVDGNLYLWDWEKIDFNDSDWPTATVVERAYAKGCKWASRWKLVPRNLPFESLVPERFQAVRSNENLRVPDAFPAQSATVMVPANTKARMVLDRGHYTTAYPELKVGKGSNARIRLTYAEAPFIDISKKERGHRGEVDGKVFFGFYDEFIANGEGERVYKPLWWRAYRYVLLEIETYSEELFIHDFFGHYASYPFVSRASLAVTERKGGRQNQQIHQMLEIGDRTLRACAHEHYMDCPYYEESQFQGDNRIQMLASYYQYGDPALSKQAITLFSWSLNNEGFLSARYPTNSFYYIPNYSLYWIGMLYNYFMLYPDHPFVESQLPVMRSILAYFERNEKESGGLKPLAYHQFVDWSFPSGEPPIDAEGNSAVVELHYLMALQWAATLEKAMGKEAYYYQKYSTKAAQLKKHIRQQYWNSELQLVTDLPGHTEKLSQHANSLAILTEVVTGEEATKLMQKVLAKKNMVAATLYWSFYVFEALQKADLGHEYLNHLGVWEEVMALGVTTWPETGINSRSECHAWGASPNYHFLKIVAGISPLAPGFSEVEIAPNLGELQSLDAVFPHWQGSVTISLQRQGKKIKARITLPPGLTGIFRWEGKTVRLVSGYNAFES
jgi:hypothetical protein